LICTTDKKGLFTWFHNKHFERTMNATISKLTATTLPRDQYGALTTANVLSAEQQLQVKELLDAAVKADRLPEPYIWSGKNEFECLNLDVYDVLLSRKRVIGIVVQARTFWKHVRKGYTRSGKDYYLLTRVGRKITVTDIDKATCAKRAKNTTALGQLVNHYLGAATVACKTPDTPVMTAYKVLAKTAEGRLVSAFDGSEYKVGKWRSEAARPDHEGGFYYYLDKPLAVSATKRGGTFAASVAAGKSLVLCEVEIAGREIEYSSGKWAASRLRVMEVLETVAIDEYA
jgi:hypothetical protein